MARCLPIAGDRDRGGQSILPPPLPHYGNLSRDAFTRAERLHFTMDGGALLPLFQLQGAQPVAQPFVEFGEDL